MAAHHRQLQEWAENCPETSKTAPRSSPPRSLASRAGMPRRCGSTRGDRRRPGRTIRPQPRRSRASSQRASTQREESRGSPSSTCGRPGTATCLGRRRQCAAARPASSAPRHGRASARCAAHHRGAKPSTWISRRSQGVAGGGRRVGARESDRHAAAHCHRACRAAPGCSSCHGVTSSRSRGGEHRR